MCVYNFIFSYFILNIFVTLIFQFINSLFNVPSLMLNLPVGFLISVIYLFVLECPLCIYFLVFCYLLKWSISHFINSAIIIIFTLKFIYENFIFKIPDGFLILSVASFDFALHCLDFLYVWLFLSVIYCTWKMIRDNLRLRCYLPSKRILFASDRWLGTLAILDYPNSIIK